MNKNVIRANKILDIARRMAEQLPEWQVRSQVEEITLHSNGYAEPGYDVGACGIIATGNWNEVTKWDKVSGRTTVSDIPKRVSHMLEKMGVEIEWSDEWCSCGDCGKLFRTSPDSYGWQPSYVMGDGEVTCHECIAKDPVSHLESLEGLDDTCNTISSINPGDYGYRKVGEEESGFHTGQNGDPKKVAKEMRAQGHTFLFNLDDVGQFDMKWSVWVKEDEGVEECDEDGDVEECEEEGER